MDVVTLSRIQFALTIMFHYLFPPLAIGMGVFLVFLEARYLKTKDPQFEAAAKFWTKIFALNFALGVASGIVMEFQFGTNWAVYSRYVGDVFGSALAAEGIFAFFLESGFLALLGLWLGQGFGPNAFLCNPDGCAGIHFFRDLDYCGDFLAADAGWICHPGFRHSGRNCQESRDYRFLECGLQSFGDGSAGSCADSALSFWDPFLS